MHFAHPCPGMAGKTATIHPSRVASFTGLLTPVMVGEYRFHYKPQVSISAAGRFTMSIAIKQPGFLRKLPPRLLQPLRLVPGAVKKPLIEFALQEFFKESIAQGNLDILENRTLQLTITDVKLSMTISVKKGHPVLISDIPEPEVRILGNLEEFVLLAANREDPDTQFFQRRICIEGDTELGLEIKNLIYSLDPDRLPAMITRFLHDLGWLVEKSRLAGM
jgi:predicted lipid carrier protein YhbT